MPTAPQSVLTRDELVEVYEIWQLLGPMATARAAVVLTREQLLEAVELVSLMRTEDVSSLWAQHNLRFHGLLEDAGGGPRLVSILSEFRELTEATIREAVMAQTELMQVANAEHEEILRAVIAGDPEAAADATFRHLNSRLHGMLAMRACPAGRAAAGSRPSHARPPVRL
jgi:GntR family transcriptional regulator, transcriptional repressor for pyruvate dehydrogenase complex